MYIDLNWDAGFTYVPNSWSGEESSVATSDEATTLSVTGVAAEGSGSTGFILPSGTSIFTFELQAPDSDHLQYELDDNGNPASAKAALNIAYEFSTGADDPCIIESMNELSGNIQAPYRSAPTHIIVNKHITGKIKY
jgi:hypothetical protein